LSYDFVLQKQSFLLAAASARVGDRREVGHITGGGAPRGRDLDRLGGEEGGAIISP
jgi:hypothetical protein